MYILSVVHGANILWRLITMPCARPELKDCIVFHKAPVILYQHQFSSSCRANAEWRVQYTVVVYGVRARRHSTTWKKKKKKKKQTEWKLKEERWVKREGAIELTNMLTAPSDGEIFKRLGECCAVLCNYYRKHRKYFRGFSPKNRVKKNLLCSSLFKYGAEKSGTTILFFSRIFVAKTAKRSVVSCCPQEVVSY